MQIRDFPAQFYTAIGLPSLLKCRTKLFEALILPQCAFNISTKVPKPRKQMEYAIKFFPPIFNFEEYNNKSFRLVVDSKHVFTHLTVT